MVLYAKVRRMFYREHLSISEIRRRHSTLGGMTPVEFEK
jgi:hypothetical protein